MSITQNKEWFEKSAEIEGNSEVGAEVPPREGFFQLECRTWVWLPDKTRGAFYSENLRQIADELEKLNMKTQTEELQKELELAELEKIRAIDKVKDLKAKIAEAEKEPSIFELMPIGSVWCGREVMDHDGNSVGLAPIKIKHWGGNCDWPSVKFLRKLIAEQRRFDAMKRAADAAVFFSINNQETSPWLRTEIEDYRKIIEKEGE